MWQKNYSPVEAPQIGMPYHVRWASKAGMCWICIAIQERTVTLQTPKTRKILRNILKTDLLHTRKNSKNNKALKTKNDHQQLDK